MVIQRSAGGNTVYFLGEVSSSGSPFYFPAVYFMKEPLPILTLTLLALLYALYRGRRMIRNLKFKWAQFSMLFFIIIYGLYSITSSLNIGVRHLLPIMPFIYILTAMGLKSLLEETSLGTKKLGIGFVVVLTAWFLISVGRAYPYYLSYFNEVIGTDNGWRYVTDSNYDWGQDLKRLQAFVDEEGIPKIAVDYFGGGNPNYYLGDKAILWQSARGSPRESGIEWLAVSINTLQGAKGEPHPEQLRNPRDEYRWLTNYEVPYARAGKSIFIYKL